MYRGFKLTIGSTGSSFIKAHHQRIGLRLHNEHEVLLRQDLRYYFLRDNYLDGNGIQKAWFPQIGADIFISHSHQDSELAYGLAGWLFDKFRLTCFIDSGIWGYADKLLKEIDKLFCRNEDGIHYDYEKRNLSTSHIHLMLASAISSLMDKTECLFFLNTPQSLSYDQGNAATESPWLYYEIGQSQLLRKRFPERELYEGDKQFSRGGLIEKSLGGIRYEVDLSHLSPLNDARFASLYRMFIEDPDSHALDLLYRHVPPKKISNQLSRGS